MHKIIAIIIFLIMYILMVVLPKRRAVVALTAAVIMIAGQILPISKVLPSIDWNVLMMIFGTMVIVDYFIESKMPNKIAESLLRLSKNVMWVTILMSLFSGIISAFIDNVATVLMVAPVGLAICKSSRSTLFP